MYTFIDAVKPSLQSLPRGYNFLIDSKPCSDFDTEHCVIYDISYAEL